MKIILNKQLLSYIKKKLTQLVKKFRVFHKYLNFHYCSSETNSSCKSLLTYNYNEIDMEIIYKIVTSFKPDPTFTPRLSKMPRAYTMKFWENHFEWTYFNSIIPPKSKILDFGCGTGHSDIFLAKEGHIVYGMDISPIAIAVSSYLKSLHPDLALEFYLANICTTEIQLNVDWVWCSNVLEHIGDWEPIFQGLTSVVGVGTPMLVSVPKGNAYDDPNHVHHWFSVEELYKSLSLVAEVNKVESHESNTYKAYLHLR